MAKVSIVIPAYNAANIIGVCLKAVLGQTYSDLEVLVVDDGSADDTLSVCREYAQKDSRIRVISAEHAGVSAARNRGMELATGVYLTFMDSDDFPESNLIEEYLKTAEFFDRQSSRYAWVMSGMQVDVYSGTMEDESVVLPNQGERILLPRGQIADLCRRKLFNFITNKLYRLDAIREQGLRFREEIQIAEDLQFNLDYLRAVEGDLAMLNKPLYHYVRLSNNSLSLIYYENAIEHTKAVYENLLDFMKDQQGVGPEDVLEIKAIYLVDWTSRMTALYESGRLAGTEDRRTGRQKIQQEVRSGKFRQLLEEVHTYGGISMVRYLALKTGQYGIYCFLRKIYRVFNVK